MSRPQQGRTAGDRTRRPSPSGPGVRRVAPAPWGVGAAVGLCASLVVLHLPRLPAFQAHEFNWQGKVLALGVAVAMVAAWPGLTGRRVGLGAPGPGWVRPFVVTLAAFVAAGVLLNVLSPSHDPSAEAALFQATMPGLQEELLFRGVLFALLDQRFRGRRRLWGADVGWSLPATSLLFAGIHGVGLADGHVVLHPAAFAFTAVLGFVLGWLRARCGSIWPCVILHNTWNMVGVAVAVSL